MMDFSKFQKITNLKDGREITIRAICPEDKVLLAAAFYQLEKESRYSRFFGFKEHISDEELRQFTEIDFDTEVALVITTVVETQEIIIAAGRYILMTAASAAIVRAEVAFVVEEDYQGQGLAGRLFDQLLEIARVKGVSTFEAEILPQNKAMLAVFTGKKLPMKKTMVDRLVHISLSL